MSHSKEQLDLVLAIAKRDEQQALVKTYKERLAALAVAADAAAGSEAEAQANCSAVAADRMRSGSTDTKPSAAARKVYETAMVANTIAETERDAGKAVLAEAEATLANLTKVAARCVVAVAKEKHEHDLAAIKTACKTAGDLLARRRTLINFARTTANDLTDPIPPDSIANPLTQEIKDLLEGKGVDVGFSEQSMIDAKLGANQ